jgi:hypothetical protein
MRFVGAAFLEGGSVYLGGLPLVNRRCAGSDVEVIYSNYETFGARLTPLFHP